MPDIQKFIYSLVYRVTNGTSNKANRKRNCRTDRSRRKETSNTQGESGTSRIADKRNSGLQGISEQSQFSRRNIQVGEQFQMEGGEDKEGAFSACGGHFKERSSSEGNASNASKAKQPKAPLISFSLFLFSNYNVLLILQAIDDICYHVNPILLGAMFK